jgi:hypothetical protein
VHSQCPIFPGGLRAQDGVLQPLKNTPRPLVLAGPGQLPGTPYEPTKVSRGHYKVTPRQQSALERTG